MVTLGNDGSDGARWVNWQEKVLALPTDAEGKIRAPVEGVPQRAKLLAPLPIQFPLIARGSLYPKVATGPWELASKIWVGPYQFTLVDWKEPPFIGRGVETRSCTGPTGKKELKGVFNIEGKPDGEAIAISGTVSLEYKEVNQRGNVTERIHASGVVPVTGAVDRFAIDNLINVWGDTGQVHIPGTYTFCSPECKQYPIPAPGFGLAEGGFSVLDRLRFNGYTDDGSGLIAVMIEKRTRDLDVVACAGGQTIRDTTLILEFPMN